MGIFKREPAESPRPQLRVSKRTPAREATIGYEGPSHTWELDVSVDEGHVTLNRNGSHYGHMAISKEELRLLVQFVAECEADS